MIPQVSTYPEVLDSDMNLYLVHDSLRVRLLEDYNPGDTSILIDGDNTLFPPTGYITLTEQCSDPNLRAITFWYASKTSTTFDGLILLPEFTDTPKPKFQTNVTMNVMAEHHNAIKDALIAIETFVGVKGTTDVKPLGSTMEGRVNFLRNLVLRPRAWFSVSQRIGIVPLTITVTDLSFRSPTSYVWSFGDGTSSNISNVISTTASVVQHTYYEPGIFDITLNVFNDFGNDTIVLPSIVNARSRAPDPAIISITDGAFQLINPIDPTDSFLYTHLVPGILKTRINTFVNLAIENSGQQPNDDIISYTWKLGDDLNHVDSPSTKASYSIGGIYDIKIRVDTQFGAYRTTTLRGGIEVVEDQNLFLCIFDPAGAGVTQNINSYEFGQVSETFKVNNRSSLPVTRDYTFLDSSSPTYLQQKREFLRNNGHTNRNNVMSGDNGTAVVYWSEGGSPLSNQKVRITEYEGFTDVWRTPTSFTFNRPWNWVSLNAPNGVYFLFGSDTGGSTSTNTTRSEIDFTALTKIDTTLTLTNFKNGAEELLSQVGAGSGFTFSVYRSTWNDNNGYIIRNDSVNAFFRLKSFYRTEGVVSDPLLYVRKLTDMPGSVKLEGQMVSLTQGVYFFNNSGEIAVYNPIANTWAVGGPGANSPSFRSLQDSSVSGFDSQANTLLAASDKDRRAYLSYDYSPNVFLRFNEADLTFVSLIPRPLGEQFVAGCY
jgi:PKD repeat protein